MTSDDIVSAISDALEAIDTPRLFETERGYQGELLAQLHRRLALQHPAIIEQEYQKQLGKHGMAIRPDIILHEPFDERIHPGRDFGNLAVIELKLRSSKAAAVEDFNSLAEMIRVLKYPLGIFVNVNSQDTFGDVAPLDVRASLVAFAVRLVDGKVAVRMDRLG